MVNRPVNAPCWVVYTEVRGGRYYVASPRELVLNGSRMTGPSGYDGVFGISNVEPFVSELDAIACAILVDGAVDKYMPGSQWPEVSIAERLSCMKDHAWKPRKGYP